MRDEIEVLKCMAEKQRLRTQRTQRLRARAKEGGGRWEEEGRYISERRTIFDWVNVKARKKNKNVTNFSMPASLN